MSDFEEFKRFRATLPYAAEDQIALEDYSLFSGEYFWRDHYMWLEEKGYALRARYHPEWVASWTDTDKSPSDCEDGQVSHFPELIMDATRVSDGARVVFKKITILKHPNEAEIGRLFSTEPHASHRLNHCVPIYDVLQVPDDERLILIVMPILYTWRHPDFDTIGEAVDFIRQVFEGLQYMHSIQVAHNDVKSDNVMMDPLNLHDELPHPANPRMSLDYSHEVKRHYSRVTRPVRYFHTDFGYSKRYKLEDGPPREYVKGFVGDPAPEFKTAEYCNPFQVDVYRVGNIVRTNFTHFTITGKFTKRGFGFMRPLLEDMCHEDPAKRPTMDEVVARFEDVVKGLSSWKLRSRVVDKSEPLRYRLHAFPGHWSRQVKCILKQIPSIPSP